MRFGNLNLLILLISVLFLPDIFFTHAQQPKVEKSIFWGEYNNFLPSGEMDRFAGETRHYDISFLWFENAASAKVSFFWRAG